MDERYYRNEAGSRDSGRAFSRAQGAPQYQQPAQQSYQPTQYSGMGTSTTGGVVIYSPRTYQDVQLLIDHLKMREQVIVDFSTLNQQSTYRILDFMSGAVYAVGGSIQQITKNIFLFAPQGVTITIPPQLRA